MQTIPLKLVYITLIAELEARNTAAALVSLRTKEGMYGTDQEQELTDNNRKKEFTRVIIL